MIDGEETVDMLFLMALLVAKHDHVIIFAPTGTHNLHLSVPRTCGKGRDRSFIFFKSNLPETLPAQGSQVATTD